MTPSFAQDLITYYFAFWATPGLAGFLLAAIVFRARGLRRWEWVLGFAAAFLLGPGLFALAVLDTVREGRKP